MENALPADKPTLLKKNVRLVHCSGTLSLLERKVFNILLLQAYDTLKVQEDHRMPIRTLLGLMNTNTNNYQAIRSALHRLVSTPLEIDVLNRRTGQPKYSVAGLISFGEIENGMVTWRYDRFMVDQLHNPEVFAQINLSAQREFSSQFALNLHENASRFRDVGSTGWWTVDEFRKLVGAEAKLYQEFFRLRQRVIEPAVQEINRVSDLLLSAEYERKAGRGAAVAKIRFLISPNPQRPLFKIRDFKQELRDKPLYASLKELGCSDALCLNILGWGDEAAQKTYDSVISGFQADRIKKPAAYIAKLFAENARPGPTVAESRKETAKSEAADAEAREARARAMGEARKVYERQRREQCLAQLSEEAVQAWEQRFLGDPSRAAAVKRYIRNGRIGGLGKALLDSFIVNALIGPPTEDDFQAWWARNSDPSQGRGAA